MDIERWSVGRVPIFKLRLLPTKMRRTNRFGCNNFAPGRFWWVLARFRGPTKCSRFLTVISAWNPDQGAAFRALNTFPHCLPFHPESLFAARTLNLSHGIIPNTRLALQLKQVCHFYKYNLNFIVLQAEKFMPTYSCEGVVLFDFSIELLDFIGPKGI